MKSDSASVEDRNFHNYLWKRYDESLGFRLMFWSAGVGLAVFFAGIPFCLLSLGWRTWHGTTLLIETTPDALIHWSLLALMWLNMFVSPSIKKCLKSKAPLDSQLTQSPRHAEFLLWLLLPSEGREAAIGDTNEKFEMMIGRFGSRRARLWYWGEVARSAWPLISYLGGRIWKWTLFGSVADWMRRHI